jgi:hypothetical protein
VTEEQVDALADVRAMFREYHVDHEETVDGGLWIILRGVTVGDGWNRALIDLAVKLQVTFPTTPPYPFYCEPGLARTNGHVFSPTQTTNVDVGDGIQRTQISLRINGQERFDTENETLSARFVAVIDWLRNPR